MTTIPWIKCSDEMPPEGKCIIKQPGISPSIGYIRPETNAYHLLINDVEWIPYDEQTWKDLNK